MHQFFLFFDPRAATRSANRTGKGARAENSCREKNQIGKKMEQVKSPNDHVILVDRLVAFKSRRNFTIYHQTGKH